MEEEAQIQRPQTTRVLKGTLLECRQLFAQETRQWDGFRDLASFSPNFCHLRSQLEARGVEQQHAHVHHRHGHVLVRAKAQTEVMQLLSNSLQFLFRRFEERLEQFSMDACVWAGVHRIQNG